MFDKLIHGGQVVDGSGNPAFEADVAITGDKIAAIGDLANAQVAHGDSTRRATEVVDARGKIVCPGFIDAHVHGDLMLLSPAAGEISEAAVRQGVTTFILGQDGCSYAPASPATIRYFRKYCAAFNGDPDLRYGAGPDPDCSWRSVDEFLCCFDHRTPLNVAYLIPNGTVRMEVMGLANRKTTPDELRTMQRLVREGMEQGAVGLSSGLEYIPSMYSDADELAALCREITRFGGIYVTHMRAYRDRVLDAMEELFSIASAANCAAHISHFSSRADVVLPKLDEAKTRGLTISFDSYPYLAGSTLLATVSLPEWVQADGIDATLTRLADERVRAKLKDWFARPESRLENIRLASIPSPEFHDLEGLPILAAAERANRSLCDLICDLLVASRLNVGVISFRTDRTESDLRRLMVRPEQMAGSDGIYVGGRPHPRGWGAFARFLGHYVRDEKVWSLEEAVRHLSSNAAQRFGLRNRGFLREGFAADIVVFDPQEIRDRATYEKGRVLAEGVEHVLVNGQFALRDGKMTGVTSGRALRRM